MAKPKQPQVIRLFNTKDRSLLPGEFTERTQAVAVAANIAKDLGSVGVLYPDGSLGFVGALDHGLDMGATGRIVDGRVELTA